MQISLINIGKRFNKEWIFRRVAYTFHAGKKYAITGANGSGKSTLLQLIAGALTYNEGTVVFEERGNENIISNIEQREMANKKLEMANNQRIITSDQHFKYIAIAAPYLDLIEEMTAFEFLSFHASFKPLLLPVLTILQTVGLDKAAHKQIRYFSSGMKQRLKLAQAFLSDVPVLLLDEPITNLDAEGIALYHSLMKNFSSKKIIIICSNDKQEYTFCDEVIEMEHYK